MSAWARLRLHPLLMKALVKSRFSRPTPIQEACIGAAVLQGKDVIGAAETGSGKTLAFGLPILQRLLDDQEKHDKKYGFEDFKIKQPAGPYVLYSLSHKGACVAGATFATFTRCNEIACWRLWQYYSLFLL